MQPRTQREADSLRRDSQATGQGGFQPGAIIAERYVVESVLGAGGMGVVVAARHVHLGQRVAIKFMRGASATDPHGFGRFLREARAVAALSSEHVAKVLDFGTLETGEPYSVMEYLSGSDLADLLHKEGPRTVPEAIGILLQACEAIAEAHSIGIVHRDLKPANLFVSKRMDGTRLVKVLDFGISKISALHSGGADENLTSTGLAMGSPAYMSPEQVRNAKAVDERSDVWALGVILYELVTGMSPFRGHTAGEIFARIVTETPPPLRQVRKDIPEGLERVVAQCLERDVAKRVPSVSALASLLLPLAPEEAKLSVARIRRVAASPDAVSKIRDETLVVPESPAVRDPGARETGPAWQRSSASEKLPAPKRPWRTFAAVATLASIATVGGVGVYAAHIRPLNGAAAMPQQTPVLSSGATPTGVAPSALVSPSAADEGTIASGQVDAAVPSTAPRAPRALHPGQVVTGRLSTSSTPVMPSSPAASIPQRVTASSPPVSPTPVAASSHGASTPVVASSPSASTLHETDLF